MVIRISGSNNGPTAKVETLVRLGVSADRKTMAPATLVTGFLTDGVTHHAAGRYREAAEYYWQAIEAQPECGDAWRLMGIISLQTGDNRSARHCLSRALAINAEDAVALSAFGNVNECEGQLESARSAYTAAWQSDPILTAAVAGLARVTLRMGDTQGAIAISESSIARGFVDANLLRTLGAARLQMRDFAEAANACRQALQIAPHADAYANLGAAYSHLHRTEDAIAACDAALVLDPRHAPAANNLGLARKIRGQFPAALTAFERAIELGSDEAHVNLGTTRLLLGDYHGGWPEYGWTTAERRANPAFASLPMWDGTAFPGRRLLVWPEQGTGDTIQMVRFLPRVRALGGSVTLACQPGTIDLFRSLDGVDELIETDLPDQIKSYNFWIPTIRLPVVFDVTPLSISTAPYVHADPQRVARLRLATRGEGTLRVGLVWSGNPAHEWDELRSCRLQQLEPLRSIPGIIWFALQQGVARAEQAQSKLPLVAINAEINDFADTAAVITQLDLVITVDTSVAHLAGALGRPAWVLISAQPDWRWQRNGDVSPWYPSLRLFRQAEHRDWQPVIAQIEHALRDVTLRSRT